MLTVKHVVCSREDIYTAPFGVSFQGRGLPGEPVYGGPSLSIPHCERGDNYGTECTELYRGTAYVMNAAGSTIGIYQLGAPPAINPAE